MARLDELLGRTIEALYILDVEVFFHMVDGGRYVLRHHTDCCEDVHIEDIDGDPAELAGATVLAFEAPTGEVFNAIAALYGVEDTYQGEESYTWTLYRLDTDKGGLVIRFIGTSNGYYSEEVSFDNIHDPDDDWG